MPDQHPSSDKNSPKESLDIIIVGGGPAGLSAGIWLSRYLYNVAIIDSGDPRNWQTQEIHGFLGAERITPREIRHRGRKACRRYGAKLIDARVEKVHKEGAQDFRFETNQGQPLQSRRVLLASGIKDNWPRIPGLEEGYGTTIHTCPNCDGYEAQGSRTAVIGAGHKAARVAMAMKTWTDRILICTHGRNPTFGEETRQLLQRMEIEVWESRIELLEGQQQVLQAIHFEDGTVTRCEHIFIAMGQHARSNDVGAQLECDHDDIGLISVDSYHRTSVENVFAAGDITPGAQLAIRAAAGGAEAALSIHHSLIPEERRVHRRC